jgi:hypothetical protein
LLAVFSDLALLALVDEATGFQATRDREALQEMLDRFLRHELAAWAKRFPDEFYVVEVEKTCAQQTSQTLASAVWTTYLGSKK